MQSTVPNLVSLSRLGLAAGFVLAGSPLLQAVIVGVAALTDFVDGWMARRFGWRSRTGEVLDPITDKVFTAVAALTLLARGVVALWEVLLLMMRDIYNAGAFALARRRRWQIRFKARMSGKVATVLQSVTIVMYLLLPANARIALVLTALASTLAIVDYTYAVRRDLRAPRSAP